MSDSVEIAERISTFEYDPTKREEVLKKYDDLRNSVRNSHENFHLEKVTNAENIRRMSDEELADFLGDWARRHLAWMQDDRGEVLWWLQQNI